jgi:ubiquinone biosynthesis protein UbiJ
VLIFVNTLAGGVLTLAAPIVAMVLKGRMAKEVKAEAQERAPESVRRVAAVIGPKLDEIVDGFADRLSEFVAEAGAALSRGIAEVLSSALDERKRRASEPDAADAYRNVDALEARLAALLGEIDELRQKVWQEP